MATLSSQVIICKRVRMDRDYINVLDYSEEGMLRLCNSSNIFVASKSNFSFLRKNNNTILADFNYADANECNYIAFQNPDYYNKWFFGWIDRVEYRGEKCVEIYYTIDEWSTWHNEMEIKPVYVEREHVNDDTYGLHVIPEPVSPSIERPALKATEFFTDYAVVVCYVSDQQSIELVEPQFVINNSFPMTCGFKAYDFEYQDSNSHVYVERIQFRNDVQALSQAGNLISITAYPKSYIKLLTPEHDTDNNCLNVDYEAVVSKAISIASPTQLNGYTPVNNKMLTFPYTYISVNNGNTEKSFKYEDFNNVNNIRFYCIGYANAQGEITLIPADYKALPNGNPAYSLTILDFPLLPSLQDSYQAWLAQKANAAKLQGSYSAVQSAFSGALSGGAAGAAVGAAGSIMNTIMSRDVQELQARESPDSIVGGTSGLLDAALQIKGFAIYQIAPKYEQAVSLDNFFSQYGYRINAVKEPNFTGRRYWNYIKINGQGVFGPIPESARMTINNALNRGTTIWHSHANVGNYLVGGSKMQNPILT